VALSDRRRPAYVSSGRWTPDWGAVLPGEALQDSPGVSYRIAVPPTPPGARFLDDFDATLARAVHAVPAGAMVIEIGGGANPLLAEHPRVTDGDVDYVVVDSSQWELAKAPPAVRTIVADVTDPTTDLPPAALVVSKMVAEHVEPAAAMLASVRRCLQPGGRYLQLSPVLYALPFVANRVLPERLAEVALRAIAPRDRDRFGKFPARYDLCRGPSRRQLARYRDLGFHVVAARGYFGHGYYERLLPLHRLEVAKSRLLVRHPVPQLCSFALVLLERPPTTRR